MCAIAGYFGASRPNADAALSDALAIMRHRGPDGSGVFIDADACVALGHNRLSIIDLSPAGRQPMVNPETGDVLAFNGEIYNFREIRAELAGRGVVFRSQSDTEVLLKALGEWGVDCLARLQGMYAFAIWRPREATLYLARDPVGVKPLYYHVDDRGCLFFASEIKAIRALSASAARIDKAALGQFLEFGYTFERERTIFRDVRKLGPGELMTCRLGSTPKISSYVGKQAKRRATCVREELVDELFHTLDAVVTQQLVADAPVGILLSGGLDSSVIAALAARHGEVRALTMAFRGSSIDERPEARAVAAHIGAEVEEIVVDAMEVIADVASVINTFDDLFGDWGTLSTRLLYKKARERGVKVVLTGEGSDEIFGGYPVFRAALSRTPSELWLFQLYRLYAGRRHGGFYRAFRRIMRVYLDETGDRFDALRLFELRNQLPNNYIMKVDKASMSVSVEARVPFLDQRVVDIALRVPREHLLTHGSEKGLLRDMAARYRLLPEEIGDRPKFGASVAASWMDEHPGFRDYARDVIMSGGGWTEALGLKGAMLDYFVRGRSGYSFPRAVSIFRNLAWRLLLLELWGKSMGVSVDLR